MSVGRSGKGWRTYHCHGNNKGKTIARFKTKGAAMRQHRAIHANKKK